MSLSSGFNPWSDAGRSTPHFAPDNVETQPLDGDAAAAAATAMTSSPRVSSGDLLSDSPATRRRKYQGRGEGEKTVHYVSSDLDDHDSQLPDGYFEQKLPPIPAPKEDAQALGVEAETGADAPPPGPGAEEAPAEVLRTCATRFWFLLL